MSLAPETINLLSALRISRKFALLEANEDEMNFSAAANEIVNWVANPDHIGGDLALLAGFVACAVLTYNFAKPYFARPTPTTFDDPAVKASRARSAKLMRDLGIGKPKEP